MKTLFFVGLLSLSCLASAQQGIPIAPSPATAGSTSATTQDKPPVKVEDWAALGRYAADNAALSPHADGRVVFYGDSITEGWAQNPALSFPGKPFIGRGISGQTTPQMLVRFRQDVTNLHPETVVILAGTNDIAGNTGPSTLEMIENNLQSMAELAEASGIRVVLASVLPATD